MLSATTISPSQIRRLRRRERAAFFETSESFEQALSWAHWGAYLGDHHQANGSVTLRASGAAVANALEALSSSLPLTPEQRFELLEAAFDSSWTDPHELFHPDDLGSRFRSRPSTEKKHRSLERIRFFEAAAEQWFEIHSDRFSRQGAQLPPESLSASYSAEMLPAVAFHHALTGADVKLYERLRQLPHFEQALFRYLNDHYQAAWQTLSLLNAPHEEDSELREKLPQAQALSSMLLADALALHSREDFASLADYFREVGFHGSEASCQALFLACAPLGLDPVQVCYPAFVGPGELAQIFERRSDLALSLLARIDLSAWRSNLAEDGCPLALALSSLEDAPPLAEAFLDRVEALPEAQRRSWVSDSECLYINDLSGSGSSKRVDWLSFGASKGWGASLCSRAARLDPQFSLAQTKASIRWLRARSTQAAKGRQRDSASALLSKLLPMAEAFEMSALSSKVTQSAPSSSGRARL